MEEGSMNVEQPKALKQLMEQLEAPCAADSGSRLVRDITAIDRYLASEAAEDSWRPGLEKRRDRCLQELKELGAEDDDEDDEGDTDEAETAAEEAALEEDIKMWSNMVSTAQRRFLATTNAEHRKKAINDLEELGVRSRVCPPPHTPRARLLGARFVSLYALAICMSCIVAVCGSNGSIMNHAIAQMNHKLAHQAVFHQHSMILPNPPTEPSVET